MSWPHGQANLRACSVASHCGHTFLRRIDTLPETEGNPPRGVLPSSRELPVIGACAEYKRTREEIQSVKWRICSAASSTKTLTSPKSDCTKNAFFKH